MFEPGTQVGRYEIQRKLGRGGMGAVYVAHDPVLGRMVAIKVFAGDLDLPDARERFSREARAAAALSHPNIVTVYDFGEFESQPFIVMEYVRGRDPCELHPPKDAGHDRGQGSLDGRALLGCGIRAPDAAGPSRHQARKPDDRSLGPPEDSGLRNRAYARAGVEHRQ